MRLTLLDQIPPALRPGYDPAAHGIGIVHLGLGAFHKAHQAALTDLALAAGGGNWRIVGISLRSATAPKQLHPQNGLYTLIERGTRTRARVIGAIADAICSAGDPAAALQLMADPAVRIVSTTVTEKAYGLDRTSQGCDPAHPAIAADLQTPGAPQGVIGLITRALAMRRAAGIAPFTVLCCDNLPENGVLLRGAVIDFAHRLDPALADWIAANVAFPSTMVDRITPAATPETLAEAAKLTGTQDLAAVETEDFAQWVIEDNFPQGRPAWHSAGAIFTDDVPAFEAMKLRMLNGAHSMLAYVGFHAGFRYVRDAMADPDMAHLVRRHLAAAAGTLTAIPGIDLNAYAADLIRRFENPSIAHDTFQIAMDGSEKMPQRIFSVVLDARRLGQNIGPFAFATAAWARHLSGATHDCAPYELRDPRADQLQAVSAGKEPDQIIAALRNADFVPTGLGRDDAFWAETGVFLAEMLSEPMQVLIRHRA